MNLTYEQLDRLLTVVEAKKARNWDWLIDWLDGKQLVFSDAEWVVRLFEEDDGWQVFEEEGEK